MNTIPFLDLTRQHARLEKEIFHSLTRVVVSGNYILGKEVRRFEEEFAKFIGVRHAIGVASGTEAIAISLMALGVEKGDGVIVPANSLPSVWGVLQAGCRPVLVDIDPETMNLDPKRVAQILKERKLVKGILVVHLYGRPAPMGEIMELAKKYNVFVVEDCAQACGAEVKLETRNSKLETRKVGSIGDVGVFSFYPTKNLGAIGDGGMVVTKNKDIADRVRMLRVYGEKPRYVSQMIGINSRLDELQAAILLAKLPHVEEWNKRRRKLAALYRRLLRSPKLLRLPTDEAGHVYHLFVIRAKKRDALAAFLEKKGIGTAIHYPTPIHLQPSLGYLGYKRGDFPRTEELTGEILSLPLYPELTQKEIYEICSTICAFYEKK